MTEPDLPEEMEPLDESAQEPGSDMRGIAIPARWESAEDLPILFVNNMFLRRQDDYFILTLGQAELPYVQQISPETLAKLEEDPIPIRAVARLGMPQSVFERFVQSINDMYEKWLISQGLGGSDDNAE